MNRLNEPAATAALVIGLFAAVAAPMSAGPEPVSGNLADAPGDPQSVTGSWTPVSGTGKLSGAGGHGLLQGRRHDGQTTLTLTGRLDGTQTGPGERPIAKPVATPESGPRLSGA